MTFLEHRPIGEARGIQTDHSNRGALVQHSVLPLIPFVGGYQIGCVTYYKIANCIRHVERLHRPIGHQDHPVVIRCIETVLSCLMVFHTHRSNVGHNFVNQIQMSDGIVFLQCYPGFGIVRRYGNIFWLKVLRQGSDG